MTLNFASEGFFVAAFEGMATNQQLIRSSLCLNQKKVMPNVVLYPVALGPKREKCFTFSGVINRGDGVTMCGMRDEEEARRKVPAEYELRGSMQQFRLDDLLDEEVKLLKMDVEGYEPEVMQGATKLLERNKVRLMLLCRWPEAFGNVLIF